MDPVRLYHNPKCSKSRGALEILREAGVELAVIEYLASPPDRAALEEIVSLLPDPPADLVRKDKNFESLGLDAKDYETADAVVELLLQHPALLQRPVAIRGSKAVIGRPSEKVRDLL